MSSYPSQRNTEAKVKSLNLIVIPELKLEFQLERTKEFHYCLIQRRNKKLIRSVSNLSLLALKVEKEVLPQKLRIGYLKAEKSQLIKKSARPISFRKESQNLDPLKRILSTHNLLTL